jgi:hypothetical protein
VVDYYENTTTAFVASKNIMRHDLNLKFVSDKIGLIGTAIMYNLGDESEKFPNNIIHATSVDENGILWFRCSRPASVCTDYPESFPARLQFYRKGRFFHVEVTGPARIVNNYYSEGTDGHHEMLIRMEMMNITYTEVGKEGKKSSTNFLKTAGKFVDYFLRHRKHARQHTFTLAH